MALLDDQYWMQQAFAQAELAYQHQEVPIGAVLVKDNELIAACYNQPIALSDPCAHAEILALRQAGDRLGNYRLLNTTLYVTLEPCAMCAMAMVHARIERLVFGAFDPKTGAAGSVLNIFTPGQFNHTVEVTSGVLADECGTMLSNFFRERRN